MGSKSGLDLHGYPRDDIQTWWRINSRVMPLRPTDTALTFGYLVWCEVHVIFSFVFITLMKRGTFQDVSHFSYPEYRVCLFLIICNISLLFDVLDSGRFGTPMKLTNLEMTVFWFVAMVTGDIVSVVRALSDAISRSSDSVSISHPANTMEVSISEAVSIATKVAHP